MPDVLDRTILLDQEAASAVMSIRTMQFPHLVAALAAAAIAAGPKPAAAQAPPKNFVMSEPPKEIATINFVDGQGNAHTVADFKSKIIVLNIWATWCVPCRREMPALDRLQAALGGPNFEIVPVSIDRKGIEAVRQFFDEIGVRKLATYLDPSGQAVRALGAVGLPTTLVLDRDGKETARVIGPAEWDDPEIVDYLRSLSEARPVPTKAAARSDGADAVRGAERVGSLRRGFQWLTALFNW
jgi:thiol-disulfide isomerase/thioredoxin